MAAVSSLIQLKGVSFAYPGATTLLDKVDFSLEQGEKIGLVGATGCGKSTLLHIIMGLLKPDRGEIRLFETLMTAERDFRQARKKMGFVFQNADDQLFSPTVIEDVAFGPLNLGYTVTEASALAREVLTDLNLQGCEDRITYTLSGGEKKLVSLATVLVMKPLVLLLDEPTTGLDKETVDRIVAILERLALSCVIVSHERDFLARVTNKVQQMDSKNCPIE